VRVLLSRMVTRLALPLVLLSARAGAQESGAGSTWRVVADVPLGGAARRFDYQSFDPATRWLWISHMGADEVLAFDVRLRRVVARVPGMPGVTGVRVVPEVGRVFAALSRSREVAILDRRTGRVLARVPGGRFPDGLAYAPGPRRLFVSDEYGRQELVIDVVSSTARRPIPLGGEAGNSQYDSASRRIWVAVQTRNELVAIDPTTETVVERIALPGIERPHGFTVDAPRRLAYVTGERNARVGVLDLRSKRVRHTYPVGEEPDVLASDPSLGRLYVASESGVIAAFEARGDSLLPLARYTAPHAHSIAVDPASHLVYVPLENVRGAPVLRILRLE
jgi:DNA-binding beta-propeller fold protein YncE